jgi:hypothetical protein
MNKTAVARWIKRPVVGWMWEMGMKAGSVVVGSDLEFAGDVL